MQIRALKDIGVSKWVEFCNMNTCSNLIHRAAPFLENPNNYSFGVIEDENIMGLCALHAEYTRYEKKEYKLGSIFNMSIPAPIINCDVKGSTKRKQIKNTIYKQIDNVAIYNNLSKITINSLSNVYIGEPLTKIFNEYSYYGYSIEANKKTVIVDLRKTKNELFRSLSKGHRCDIKKYEKQIAVNYVDVKQSNMKKREFLERIRSITTLPLKQEEFLYSLFKICAIELCYAKKGTQKLGGAIFKKYGKSVNYFASKRFVDDKIPIHHMMLWASILRYKELGLDIFDLGVITYPSYVHNKYMSKKEKIMLFKKGFGGEIKTLALGEKYFSKEYFLKQSRERIKYISNNCFDD